MGHQLSWASSLPLKVKGQLSTLGDLRGWVGGWVAEALVSMETARFRMLLALVLVQMGWDLGVGSP